MFMAGLCGYGLLIVIVIGIWAASTITMRMDRVKRIPSAYLQDPSRQVPDDPRGIAPVLSELWLIGEQGWRAARVHEDDGGVRRYFSALHGRDQPGHGLAGIDGIQ